MIISFMIRPVAVVVRVGDRLEEAAPFLPVDCVIIVIISVRSAYAGRRLNIRCGIRQRFGIGRTSMVSCHRLFLQAGVI